MASYLVDLLISHGHLHLYGASLIKLLEDGVSGDLELLYRGSRDGWKGEYFHSKCDDKSATITVIWSSGGFIFGGFSDKSWTSIHKWCKSDKYLLFSLNIISKEVGTTKINIIQDMCSNVMLH